MATLPDVMLMNLVAGDEVNEFCREGIDYDGIPDHCGRPAEFLLWGKLFPAEALGPRCYDCAARHVGPTVLSSPTL